MIMKQTACTLLVAAAFLMLASCSPQSYLLPMEIRQGSVSGMDLGGGKTISVVYLSDSDTAAQSRHFKLAEQLARSLEDGYYGGNHEAVDLYCLDRTIGADYTARDTLISLIVRTGDDVVFLLHGDNPETETYQLSALDSMSGSDDVLSFAGKVADLGKEFAPIWRQYVFELYFTESSSRLSEAAALAEQMRWDEAADLWLKEVGSRGVYRRSCSAYNLAVACAIKGNKALALQWLDRSDAVCKLPASDALRKLLKHSSK